MNSKQKHSQRGIKREYKKVVAVVKKKKAGWVDAGLDWKPKPVKRKTLVGKLDEIVSLIIRNRDKKCVLCGSTDRLTNGHVLPGRYTVLRFDIRLDGNCHTQCWPCNYKHVNHQAHYYNWFINKFGLDRWKELNREYYGQDRKHYSDKELREMYESLKAQFGHLLHKLLTDVTQREAAG